MGGKLLYLLMGVIIFLLILPVLAGLTTYTYGWEHTEIAVYSNGDTFDITVLDGYDFILATWGTPDNTPIEHYTVLFEPRMLLLGHCFRTQIQNNPVRLGCLNHNVQGTVTVGVIDSNNTVQAGFNATVTITGLKMVLKRF